MMLLADTHENADYELKVVQALHERRVDGIVIAPSPDPQHRALDYLRDKRVPTVLVDRFVGTTFDQIGVESRDATQTLVEHLIGLGHKRIALVSGAPGLSTTTERLEGYCKALAAAAQHLLSLDKRPTALMTGNNLMTIGSMQALRAAGLRVPNDISLVGFDDFDWADVFSPRLTAMAQPVEELGTRAIRLLARRIADPNARRQTVRLAPTLRMRDSAGVPSFK
jgi:LacI family transcriptional regulator